MKLTFIPVNKKLNSYRKGLGVFSNTHYKTSYEVYMPVYRLYRDSTDTINRNASFIMRAINQITDGFA